MSLYMPLSFLLLSGNFVHQQMKVFRNEHLCPSGASKLMFSHTEFTEHTQTFISGVRTREHLESTDFVAWRLMPCDRLREVRERQPL